MTIEISQNKDATGILERRCKLVWKGYVLAWTYCFISKGYHVTHPT